MTSCSYLPPKKISNPQMGTTFPAIMAQFEMHPPALPFGLRSEKTAGTFTFTNWISQPQHNVEETMSH
jgi:hypothetical protein